MAYLRDLRPDFVAMSWQDKVAFIEEYSKRRHADLNTVQLFDLAKQKTKSTKVREPKEKKEKSVKKLSLAELQKQGMDEQQLSLLKQLGLV